MTNDRIEMICNFFKEKIFFLIFHISPDFYSQNMMMWHKYDFVSDSYSQNMMTWHKYDFTPLMYVGSAVTPVLYLLPSKLKEFADYNFKFDKNGRKVSKWVENTAGKGKLLDTSNFSFSHSVFKRHILQTRKNQRLFGKG